MASVSRRTRSAMTAAAPIAAAPTRATEIISVSTDGESLFEAYHSVFSRLTSRDKIITALSKKCGSKFKYSTKDDIILEDSQGTIVHDYIFCDYQKETHYYFYRHITHEIFDPYQYFQLSNTHGNCFIFALYLSSIHNGGVANILINIVPLMEKKSDRAGNKYIKVISSQMQLAYKCFVYNDFIIINWLINIINSNPAIFNLYKNEWTLLSRNQVESSYYGILQSPYPSFLEYFTEFSNLAKNIDNTFEMTLAQILNWDTSAGNLPPHENSGIEGATHMLIQNDYKIEPIELASLPTMGGSNKNKKTNYKKTNHKKTNLSKRLKHKNLSKRLKHKNLSRRRKVA